ncbi:hypothetical protein SD78_1776 [Bacillus badius]|nr:hypothetical protein SD78_1776 [Bacillus badius]
MPMWGLKGVLLFISFVHFLPINIALSLKKKVFIEGERYQNKIRISSEII